MIIQKQVCTDDESQIIFHSHINKVNISNKMPTTV